MERSSRTALIPLLRTVMGWISWQPTQQYQEEEDNYNEENGKQIEQQVPEYELVDYFWEQLSRISGGTFNVELYLIEDGYVLPKMIGL